MNDREFADYVKQRYEQDPNGRLDRFGKDFISTSKFSIRVVKNGGDLNWTESHIGTSFGSTQDYGRRWETIHDNQENQWSPDGQKTTEDLKQEVRDRLSRHPRQIEFYDKDEDRVVTGVAVRFTESGYAIYPDKYVSVSD